MWCSHIMISKNTFHTSAVIIIISNIRIIENWNFIKVKSVWRFFLLANVKSNRKQARNDFARLLAKLLNCPTHRKISCIYNFLNKNKMIFRSLVIVVLCVVIKSENVNGITRANPTSAALTVNNEISPVTVQPNKDLKSGESRLFNDPQPEYYK